MSSYGIKIDFKNSSYSVRALFLHHGLMQDQLDDPSVDTLHLHLD